MYQRTTFITVKAVELEEIRPVNGVIGQEEQTFARDIVLVGDDGQKVYLCIHGKSRAAITIKGDEHSQLTQDLERLKGFMSGVNSKSEAGAAESADTIGITKDGVTQRLPISFDGNQEPDDLDVLAEHQQ